MFFAHNGMGITYGNQKALWAEQLLKSTKSFISICKIALMWKKNVQRTKGKPQNMQPSHREALHRDLGQEKESVPWGEITKGLRKEHSVELEGFLSPFSPADTLKLFLSYLLKSLCDFRAWCFFRAVRISSETITPHWTQSKCRLGVLLSPRHPSELFHQPLWPVSPEPCLSWAGGTWSHLLSPPGTRISMRNGPLMPAGL